MLMKQSLNVCKVDVLIGKQFELILNENCSDKRIWYKCIDK